VERNRKPRCTYAPYSYTHVDLYRHWPSLAISAEKELHITSVGYCYEDNPTCNALRERLAALSVEDRYALYKMAEKVDFMLDGTVMM